MAICKKMLGTNKSKSNFNDIFKKWIPHEEEVVNKARNDLKECITNHPYIRDEKKIEYDGAKLITVKEFADRAGVSSSTIRRQISKGQFPDAFKNNGIWLIPVKD